MPIVVPLGPNGASTCWRCAAAASDRAHGGSSNPVPRPADHHFDQAVLFAAGLLSARERKQLRDYWRAQYEEAYAEGFVHCLGPSQWLHGDAARDAHFRWYAIPSALIDEWDAERKEAAECRRTAS
jgi:uncharacterized protein involved in type VI secretion and phage assembly